MPVLVVLALLVPPAHGRCVVPPVPGRVTHGFAPGPAYGGHWGVDFAVDEGTTVRAVMAGNVTFAGTVVDNLTVTVDHGGSVRTSYSFLSRIAVGAGTWVEAGDQLGRSGQAHGEPGLHFSLRVGNDYRDPLIVLHCLTVPHPGLRLLGRRPAVTLYAVRRAERDLGRHIRPTSRRASHGGRRGAQSARPGRRHVHHRRRSVSESR